MDLALNNLQRLNAIKPNQPTNVYIYIYIYIYIIIIIKTGPLGWDGRIHHLTSA